MACLKDKIKNNEEQLKNQNITEPSIDDRYYCLTCGNVGLEHPNTAMCFICGDDNWEVVKGKGKETDIGY